MLTIVKELIIKRKGVLLFSIITAVCITFLSSAINKPVFESKAIITVGEVGGVGEVGEVGRGISKIDSAKGLTQRIVYKYNVGVNKTSLPAIVSVELDKVAPDYVTVCARANTEYDAQGYLENVLTEIMSEQKTTFNMLVNYKKDELTYLNKKLSELQKMQGLGSEIDKAKITKIEIDTQRDVRRAEINLSEAYTHPPRILRSPSEPKEVKATSILQLSVVAVLNGIILGLLLSMAMEISWRARIRELVSSHKKLQ